MNQVATQTKRILIVEDEFIISLNTEAILERLGYSVVGMAGSPTEAIEAVQDHKPDLVLMDIHLGAEMDGIEVMEHIRSFSQVPVIFISGNSDPSARKRANEGEKVIGFLIKPFIVTDLRNLIQTALYP